MTTRLPLFPLVLVLVALLAAGANANNISVTCTKTCKASGAKVLFWGLTPTHNGGEPIVQWLNSNIPSAQFDLLNPANNTLTSSLLAQYDLVVLCDVIRSASVSEASALWNWIENGGFFFCMSGFYNSPTEIAYSNSYFVDFDGSPKYICAPYPGCIVSGCSGFYPGQAILSNIPNCTFDYVGGYPSTYAMSYNGTDTFNYLFYILYPNGDHPVKYDIGLQVDLCGANHPKGGRMVFWGDEWISYTSTFTTTNDAQVWFNILNYLNLCIPQCTTSDDCGCGQTCGPYGTCIPCTDPSCGAHVAAVNCASASAHSSTRSLQLSFDPSGGCGPV